MSSFDIAYLAEGGLPVGICPQCNALFKKIDLMELILTAKNKFDMNIECPICNIEFLPEKFPELSSNNMKYLKIIEYIGLHEGLFNSYPKYQLNQLTKLALVSKLLRKEEFSPLEIEDSLKVRKGELNKYPISYFLKLISLAKCFIHFTSFNMSTQMLGVLRLASYQGVKVRGVVSIPNNVYLINEINLANKEDSNLKIKIYDSEAKEDYASLPHQKVFIVDGLIALGGSVNLTDAGWRKLADDRESIEVKTKSKEVIDFNNQYFAKLWCSDELITDRMNKIADYTPF